MAVEHPLAITFGILGNVVSFMVYLAPLPTFYRIAKKKNTEGFQALPYMVALFSATIWIYYATLKPNGFFLITINAMGCIIESVYIVMFIIYAPRKTKIKTIKFVLSLNVGVFSVVLLVSLFLFKGENKLRFMGWVCTVFAVTVSAAPLSIMRLVIRTKSVEFMPFPLSFFLTVSTVMWFTYGLLINDLFVALPNVVGFTLGTIQMLLYAIYMNKKRGTNIATDHQSEHAANAVILSTTNGGRGSEVHPVDVREKPDQNTNDEAKVKTENNGADDIKVLAQKEDEAKREGESNESVRSEREDEMV